MVHVSQTDSWGSVEDGEAATLDGDHDDDDSKSVHSNTSSDDDREFFIRGICVLYKQYGAWLISKRVMWCHPRDPVEFNKELQRYIRENPNNHTSVLGVNAISKRAYGGMASRMATQEPDEPDIDEHQDPRSSDGKVAKCIAMLRADHTYDSLHTMFYYNEPPKVRRTILLLVLTAILFR